MDFNHAASVYLTRVSTAVLSLTICDLCNNNAESVKLSLLDDICKALDCKITDIFTIV